jgi:fibronectin-binding autotransporter adhesin
MPIYRGNTELSTVFRGNTELNKIFRGNNEVFDGVTFVDANFLLVAGGAGGGRNSGASGEGGGGAGGIRTSYGSCSGGGCGAESNFVFNKGVTYTFTVGAGGGYCREGNVSCIEGSDITNVSTFGGGRGSSGDPLSNYRAFPGGSGGGEGGSGPRVATGCPGCACEGFAGGNKVSYSQGGGGGGGGSEAGEDAAPSSQAGDGGDGLCVSIEGTSIVYAGGGGGSALGPASCGWPNYGNGGTGGGGRGGSQEPGRECATSGEANKGAGGGGMGVCGQNPGQGGSGVVVIRIPTSKYSGTTSGSPTVTTNGSDTILKYTGTGTYTH